MIVCRQRLSKRADTALADMQMALVEPFMVTLLRMLGQIPDEDDYLSVIDANVNKFSLQTHPSQRAIFQLYRQCRATETGQRVLVTQCQLHMNDTTPDFLVYLRRAMNRAIQDEKDIAQQSLPSTPLYERATRTSPLRAKGATLFSRDELEGDRVGASLGSIAGRGGQPAQSLMSPGALALWAVEERDRLEHDCSDSSDDLDPFR